jgi:NAD(P)-dependent dehydrogenase (short-subunit alcohol dehydrogenase family)
MSADIQGRVALITGASRGKVVGISCDLANPAAIPALAQEVQPFGIRGTVVLSGWVEGGQFQRSHAGGKTRFRVPWNCFRHRPP